MQTHAHLPIQSWLLVAIVLCGGLGCQSGRISLIRLDATGHMMVFQDPEYDTIYFADGSGVRRLPFGPPPNHQMLDMHLSPDGEWLFLVASERGHYNPGDEVDMRLWALDGSADYEAAFPRELIEWYAETAASQDPLYIVTGANKGPTPLLWLEGAPTVVLGMRDGPVYRWQPGQFGNWTKLEHRDAALPANLPADPRGPIPMFAIQWPCTPIAPDPYYPPVGPIVTVPYDGWNAQRVIWVRPDATTLELVRQNDAPLRVVARTSEILLAILSLPFDLLVLWESPTSFVMLTGMKLQSIILAPFEPISAILVSLSTVEQRREDLAQLKAAAEEFSSIEPVCDGDS